MTNTYCQLLLCLLFLSTNGIGQLHYKAKTISTSEGLSDKRVTCFLKDSKGYMWIGTRNGLNRYDGHSFTVFRPSLGNSISNEVINDIAEDKTGKLWVATMEGLNIYNPSNGKWETIVPAANKSDNDIPSYIIWDLSIDENGLVWLACDVFEFSSYDPDKKKFSLYDWPEFARKAPFNFANGRYNTIQKFVRKNANEFWLGCTKGLVSLNIKTGEFNLIGSGYHDEVSDLQYDKFSGKVFLSASDRLFVYDEIKDLYSELFPKNEAYPSLSYSPPGKKELWLAARTGLFRINDDRTIATKAIHIPELSGSILPGGVNTIFTEDNGNRWAGTANGISVYDPLAQGSAFLPLLQVSDKTGSNKMASVYYDETSDSYFACSADPALVFIINRKTEIIKKIDSDRYGKKFSRCQTIKNDSRNDLWLMTENKLYKYDRSLSSFIEIATPNAGAAVAYNDMTEDADGNLWFACSQASVLFYNTKEKKFTDPAPDFNYPSIVTAVCADNKNRTVWIGTFSEGLFRFDLSSGKMQGYYSGEKVPHYSPLNLVHDLFIAANGSLWVGTHSGGVFLYNNGMPYEKAFTQFDMKKGLPDNNIVSISGDENNAIWLLSGNGLFAIDYQGQLLYNPGSEQGFGFSTYASDDMVSHGMYFNKKENELLVGVGGGVLFYKPFQSDTTLKIPMVLSTIKVDGHIVKGSVNNDTKHKLPYRNNAIDFEFASLYYGALPGIKYEYKLNGYDKDWRDAGNDFTAGYQNLPPGNYSFSVVARDGSGRVAGEISGFHFSINSPFWQKWWFIAACIGIVLTMLYLFMRSFRQKLKDEKILSSFATSLYGQNTVEDIYWDTARNCVEKMGFGDCVVYEKEEGREIMVQKAAFGPKNPHRREILNRIEIPVGQGIVGTVASTGKAEIIRNTAKDARYIIDDEVRLSEIAVPVLVDGKVFAVIDSENHAKNFFNRHHLRLLKKIAGICSERISKYLTEEKLRTKIARDLHDEMGSTLTSINIISKVAMQSEKQDPQVKLYLQRIKDHSSKMMESMSDIVWAINPANDSFDKVIVRMKEFSMEIMEPARINYYFIEEGAMEKALLNLEQRKDIFMIFKEAINNAVKYSQATEVNIVLQNKEDHFKMMITDNGEGFNADKAYSGNGLKNMHARAQELHGRLKIESIQGTGTSISLFVPLT